MISAKTPYSPQDVDYDPSRIDALNAHFERLIQKNIIQSANYCLSRDGKVFANVAIGKQSVMPEDTRPLQPNVIRGLASITKIFTATAIFKLIEDGYIRGNQAAAEILPEMNRPPYNQITIAHLLSHTSGIKPDGGCFPQKYKSPWDFIRSKKENESWIDAALKTGIYREPGKEWAYCSFGFVLLGEIINRVTGIRAENFILSNICEPCGMVDTNFWSCFEKNMTEEIAKKLADRLYVQKSDFNGYIEALKKYKNGTSFSDQDDSIFSSIPSTGGGLTSTTEDLNKFGVMLMRGGTTLDGTRVIGRKTVERMTENYTTQDIKDNCWGAGGRYRMYALGPDTRRNADSLYSEGTFFHEGAGACCLTIDPKERMVASWFVPFATEKWYAEPLYNACAVMWSGLK